MVWYYHYFRRTIKPYTGQVPVTPAGLLGNKKDKNDSETPAVFINLKVIYIPAAQTNDGAIP